MRSILTAVLFALALPLAAQTPFSIDFRNNPIGLQQEAYYNIGVPVRATGTFPIGASVNVDWSYSFPNRPPMSGTIVLTPMFPEQHFFVNTPFTDAFVGLIEGSATISYQVQSQNPTKITKTAKILVGDTLWVNFPQPYRVGENAASPDHALAVKLSKRAGIPINLSLYASEEGYAHAPADYSLLDSAFSFLPPMDATQIRFRVPQDNLAEGPETFTLHFMLRDGSGTPIGGGTCPITILDKEIQTTFSPDHLNVFAGDPFKLALSMSDRLDSYGPMYWSPVATSSSTNPGVASPGGSPVLVPNSQTQVGDVKGTTGHAGDAAITATFTEGSAIAPAVANIHVYDGKIAFGSATSVDVPLGGKITVPVTMTPGPPEVMTLRLREPVFTKFVEYDNLVSIDTSGNATLAITGSALGKTTLDIYSPGQRLIASLGVNVLAPLDVQSIIPAAGRAGTQVVISGSGFRPPCEVKFGNTPAVIYATSDTKLFVTTPAHASGIVEVPVTCSNQTRLLQFTFLGSRTRSAHH